MAVSPRTDTTITPYVPLAAPLDEKQTLYYLQNELLRLQATLDEMADATPQVADVAPKVPRKGMVRYAVAPWNPGAGDGLYGYNGTAWVSLAGGGGGGAVASVFGRTGAVVAAANDYTFAQLASRPTTIAGYGLTDAQALSADLTALAALSTTGFVRRTGAGTADTMKGWEHIASATLGAAAVTLINQSTGISSYDFIRITIDLVGYTGADTIQMQLNALANSHQYHWKTESGHAAAGAAVSWVGGTNQGTNQSVIKLAPSNTTFPRRIGIEFGNRPEKTEKLIEITSATGTGSTGTAPQKDLCSASVITAASTRISQIKLFTPTSTMLAGSTVIIEGRNP